jgi:hypothetical protein
VLRSEERSVRDRLGLLLGRLQRRHLRVPAQGRDLHLERQLLQPLHGERDL